jgi:hypothetical protein
MSKQGGQNKVTVTEKISNSGTTVTVNSPRRGGGFRGRGRGRGGGRGRGRGSNNQAPPSLTEDQIQLWDSLVDVIRSRPASTTPSVKSAISVASGATGKSHTSVGTKASGVSSKKSTFQRKNTNKNGKSKRPQKQPDPKSYTSFGVALGSKLRPFHSKCGKTLTHTNGLVHIPAHPGVQFETPVLPVSVATTPANAAVGFAFVYRFYAYLSGLGAFASNSARVLQPPVRKGATDSPHRKQLLLGEIAFDESTASSEPGALFDDHSLKPEKLSPTKLLRYNSAHITTADWEKLLLANFSYLINTGPVHHTSYCYPVCLGDFVSNSFCFKHTEGDKFYLVTKFAQRVTKAVYDSVTVPTSPDSLFYSHIGSNVARGPDSFTFAIPKPNRKPKS